MPGLNQLKQFNTDILTLGDEQKIRATRGEKAPIFPIPDDIEDRDDSDDFVLGMPQVSEDELAQSEAAALEKEKEANDFSDITDDKKSSTESNQQTPAASKLPDVSDLLTPSADEQFGDIDLSAFEEPAKPKEPVKPKEVPIEDLDLDSLLAPSNKTKPKAEPTQEQKPQTSSSQDVPKKSEAKIKPKADDSELPPELQALFENNKHQQKEPQKKEEASTDVPDFDFSSLMDSEQTPKFEEPNVQDTSNFETPTAEENIPPKQFESSSQENKNTTDEDIPDLESVETLESVDEEVPVDKEQTEPSAKENATKAPEDKQESSSTDIDNENDFNFDGDSIDLNADLPDELNEEPPVTLKKESEATQEEPTDDNKKSEETSKPIDESSADDIPNIPEPPSFNDLNDIMKESSSEQPKEESEQSTTSNNPLDEFDTSALDNLPNFDVEKNEAEETPSKNEEPAVKETPSVSEVPEEEPPLEKFDTSSIDAMDFSGDNTTPPSSNESGATDFELGNIGSTENDSFAIPGFSDTQTADLNKIKQTVATPDFTGAQINKKPKNTFTDAEYERFEKNLAEYPLNVRIALEDLIVKNEFTDDAVFQILEKVLRKVSARSLASDLEKMLDITLDVPRDYERRTAEEYNAYKKSVEYQLKNKIIPGAIITAAAAILIYCIYTIFTTFVVTPIMASNLYKKGYNCIQREEYPQSEIEFDKALNYKLIKKWFFKYAAGYREHKQYDRSSKMYKAILQRFNHEKQAGIDWADMEMKDRFNYEEAERILKREVLDFHINDPDALLLLGDNYLEWGTEKDTSKLDLAKEQYSLLLQLYGNKDQNLYLSRMMKYYIRTDNLREVLQYKEHFMPLKKALNADDLTELSGYLLDKRYGTLSSAEQNLRFNIEDVRDLLERAVKANPENPVSLYNMGRYFVETDNSSAASSYLTSALSSFAKQNIRNKRDTYKYINTYRLLGEQYLNNKEYINAEQTFGDGISLFEKENESSGFASDKNIGKLYSDLGDINYFISGNYDNALDDYTKSIENKNDNASVRYRVGYINYINKDYSNALGSFIRSSETKGEDTHLLLSLANTLSLRNDNYAAQGYYEKLITQLDKEKEIHGVMLPQVREDQEDIVDTYMKAANNLGVTLNRIANATGNSKMNAEAIVNLSVSLRAWDALTRNQETMVRLGGSNLPEQNIKYITQPTSDYTPEIFTEIPRTLNGEKGLEQ
ncbi:MAG: hypothetical protein WCQ67_08385 [Treponema sp.]